MVASPIIRILSLDLPSSMAPGGLSAFEAKRRENVANNAKLLAESQALGAKMARAAKPPPKPAAAPRKRKAAEPVQRVMPTRATRQSARLSGAGADSELTSLKTEREIIEEQKPAKRARITEDLNLSKVTLEGSRWSNGDALASFAQGAQPGVRTFTDDDIKDTSDDKLKTLRKGMAELELYDGWLPNGRFCKTNLCSRILTDILQISRLHQNAYTP